MTMTQADSPPHRSQTAGGDAGLADVVEGVARSVVGLVSRRRGVNAGVVWQSGIVVSCASAIGRSSRLPVVVANGETRDGEVRGIDPTTDLAVIAVDTSGLTPAPRRDGAPLRVGDAVFATGREGSGLVHASFGHVGAAGGAWRTWRGGTVERLIRLDGGLYPGLAGAAIADHVGQVAGVASAMLSRHHGVVLPALTVDRISAHLLAHGSVQRRYLGIVAQPVALTETLTNTLTGIAGQAWPETPRTGLLITGIGADSPAEKGGLLLGDIIVSVADQPVADLEALRSTIAVAPIDRALTLLVLRAGQPISVDVVVAARDTSSRC